MKKEHNKLRQRKKEKKREKWTEITKRARTDGQVWEIINRERKRRHVNKEIGMEEWVE